MSESAVLISKSMGEFAGTFLLVLLGCGSVLMIEKFQSLPAVWIPVIFGSVIAILICIFGKVSGAHLNPVVTITFAIARQTPIQDVFGYCVAQVAGGLSAIGVLVLIFSKMGKGIS